MFFTYEKSYSYQLKVDYSHLRQLLINKLIHFVDMKNFKSKITY